VAAATSYQFIALLFWGLLRFFWQSAEEGRNEMKYPVDKGEMRKSFG